MNKKRYEINGLSLFDIRNVYEVKVIDIMQELLPEYESFDGCSICIQDVYALAMSMIKSKYVQVGTIILRREDERPVLEKAVRFAIDKVISNPTHT